MKYPGVVRALSVVMLCLLVLGVLSVSLPKPAKAGDFPLSVYGYVTDLMGNPVENAVVTIRDVNTGVVKYATTDETGGYSNLGDEFGTNQWYVGDTMRVFATFNSQDSTPTDVVLTTENTAIGLIQIDTQFPYEIPEFGSFVGILAAIGIAGVVGVVVLSTRRK